MTEDEEFQEWIVQVQLDAAEESARQAENYIRYQQEIHRVSLLESLTRLGFTKTDIENHLILRTFPEVQELYGWHHGPAHARRLERERRSQVLTADSDKWEDGTLGTSEEHAVLSKRGKNAGR